MRTNGAEKQRHTDWAAVALSHRLREQTREREIESERTFERAGSVH